MSDETIGQLYDRIVAIGPVRYGPFVLTALVPPDEPERREPATDGPVPPIYERTCDTCGSVECGHSDAERNANEVSNPYATDIWIDLGSQR